MHGTSFICSAPNELVRADIHPTPLRADIRDPLADVLTYVLGTSSGIVMLSRTQLSGEVYSQFLTILQEVSSSWDAGIVVTLLLLQVLGRHIEPRQA